MKTNATRPRWGVSGNVKLESTITFGHTIFPFDSQPTMSVQSYDLADEIRGGWLLQQPTRQYSGCSKELRLVRSPQGTHQCLPLHAQRQPRERSRTVLQEEVNLMEPRRSLHLSQLASHPPEKPTRTLPQATTPSLEVSLGLPDQCGGIKVTKTNQPQIRLSSARHREIKSRMSKIVKDAMTHALPDDSKNLQWKFQTRKKNIAYYRDETIAKPGQTRFCCISQTHATIDELMGLFLPTDKSSVLRNNKLLYDNVIDAKVLLTLRHPTKERSMNSMYVRYTSFRTSGPLSNREMYVAVATDMIRQSDGSTVGYCLWESINDYDFLKTVNSTGLEISTSFRSGYFFHHPGRMKSASGDPNDGQTKIVYMVGMDSGSWTSGLTSRLAMEKHGSSVDRLCSYFRQNRLDPSTFVVKKQWKSKYAAKSCKQCSKSFQVLSKRVNCHACGNVICRSCISKETVVLQTIGLAFAHVCHTCLKKTGLPAFTSVEKTRSRLRQRRLHSDTASTFRHVIAVVHDDVDEDSDAGEWAITTKGIPVRPTRMAAFV